MSGETDLDRLLRTMEPILSPEAYGYGQVAAWADLPARLAPFALIAEDEGLTVIAPADDLDAAGIAHDGSWARISLTVHSSLEAVGLTAAVAAALTDRGISANVVAGLMHDHVFVQWDRRRDAMAALATLGGRP
jgi:hypothetical protein